MTIRINKAFWFQAETDDPNRHYNISLTITNVGSLWLVQGESLEWPDLFIQILLDLVTKFPRIWSLIKSICIQGPSIIRRTPRPSPAPGWIRLILWSIVRIPTLQNVSAGSVISAALSRLGRITRFQDLHKFIRSGLITLPSGWPDLYGRYSYNFIWSLCRMTRMKWYKFKQSDLFTLLFLPLGRGRLSPVDPRQDHSRNYKVKWLLKHAISFNFCISRNRDNWNMQSYPNSFNICLSRGNGGLLSLPEEIIEKIFCHMTSPADIIRTNLACKTLKRIGEDGIWWKKLCQRWISGLS